MFTWSVKLRVMHSTVQPSQQQVNGSELFISVFQSNSSHEAHFYTHDVTKNKQKKSIRLFLPRIDSMQLRYSKRVEGIAGEAQGVGRKIPRD